MASHFLPRMQSTDKSPDVRISVLELQVERVKSDFESERLERVRTQGEIYRELEKIGDKQDGTNRILWMMAGGLVVLQVVLQFVKH